MATNKNLNNSIMRVCGLMLFILSACTAYDLGNSGTTFYEPPDLENPKWEEGIREIVTSKCATCHTEQSPWYKPKNTPVLANAENPEFGLNFIGQEQFFKKENGLLSLVKLCIEKVCGKESIPMPPSYATPLSPNEKTALLNYVSKLIPVASPAPTRTPDPTDPTKPTALSANYLTNCTGCHGTDGQKSSAKIGGSKSQTQAAYLNSVKTLSPMKGLYDQGNYTDADATNDWRFLVEK